jgi:hypothetical protein
MPNMYRSFEGPGVILLAIVAFSLVLALIGRGRQIPRCYYCGAMKVRGSRPLGLWDKALSLFLVRAYRCSGCLTRFYAMRLSRTSAHELADRVN